MGNFDCSFQYYQSHYFLAIENQDYNNQFINPMKFMSDPRIRQPNYIRPSVNRPSSFGWQPLQYTLIYERSIPIRSYQIPLKVYENQSNIIEWRKIKNAPIVQVLAVKSDSVRSIQNSTITVLTQHIVTTLDQINNIGLPHAIYLLREMVKAYMAIFYRLGYVNISERCCGVNCQGEFLGWINENLALNRVTQMVLASEAAATKKINQIVYYKCKDREHPIFNQILSVESKFDAILAFISASCKKYNIIVPSTLLSQDVTSQSRLVTSSVVGPPKIPLSVSSKFDQRINKNEVTSTEFRQSSCSTSKQVKESYLKNYDLVHSPKQAFNRQIPSKVHFSYSGSKEKETPYSSQRTIPHRSIKQIRSHSPSYVNVPNTFYDQIRIQEFGFDKVNQESRLSISVPSKAPELTKTQLKKRKNIICSNQYNFYFQPAKKAIGLTKKSECYQSKSISPIYQSMNKPSTAKLSADEVYSNKSSRSTHHKDSKVHSTNTSSMSNNAESGSKNTSFLSNFNTIPYQNAHSFIEKDNIPRGSAYNFGGLFPAVDKIQEESRQIDSLSKNQNALSQSMEITTEQHIQISIKNIQNPNPPYYVSDHVIVNDNPFNLSNKGIVGFNTNHTIPVQNLAPPQWKNQIKHLILHNDDNLKQSVYCGPQIRAQPIKLQMLHNFGRQIQGSMLPQGDYYA